MDKNNDDSHTLEQERAHTEIGAKYAKLSVKGAQEYRNLQFSAIKQFGFWMFVGSFGGLSWQNSWKFLLKLSLN